MAGTAVLEFSEANFESDVLQAEGPVLVDFWAEWCQPCRMLAPLIDELAAEYDGKAKVGKLDIDANRDIAIKYGINAIPSIIVFKDGEVADKSVGMTSKADMASKIDAAL